MKEQFYNHPLITVVTVCYNSAKTIETSIQSILSQTYDNYEYFIVDGASTDNTLEIIKKYEPAFNGKLRYITEKDTGIYNAMNKGIKRSNGALIGILNSDDYYSPNTLELVAEKFEAEAYPLLVINGDMIRVSESGEEIYHYKFTDDLVEKKQCFGHPAMFAAKAVYDKIGFYDETYRFAADGEWQYRAHEDSDVRYVLCHEVFNHMREGGASDNPKYRWKWFSERSRMMISHKRGRRLIIYLIELKKIIVTDIKARIPNRYKSKMYKIRYKK